MNPDGHAAQALATTGDAGERAALQRLAAQGSAEWLGDWTTDVARAAGDVVRKARAAQQTPTFVAYAIPHRDCGAYSAGGATDAGAYRDWIADLAEGVRGADAVVILEPDALAGMDCLNEGDQQERLQLLRDAGVELTQAGASVYLDAGVAGWIGTQEMTARLKAAGVENLRGFALNVSNYETTATSESYGDALVNALGGKAHYVIDTSRNGAGPAHAEGEDAWCNPPGRAIGSTFSTDTDNANVDALLWVKVVGDSDGECNGGPAAGTFWTAGAVALATNPTTPSGS
ncbi:MAG: glycoside hydrolase family 6 protein [Janthinobacterium lividum]